MFTIFPSVLSGVHLSQVWVGILFLLLVLVGLDTQCVYVQNVLSGLLHMLKNKRLFRWKYKYALQLGACLLFLGLGLVFTSQVWLVMETSDFENLFCWLYV